MIRRLCCRLGFHRNRDLWRGPFDGVRQDVLWKCLDCGREEKIRLICFLTGPRTGPMHPEAETRKSRPERDDEEYVIPPYRQYLDPLDNEDPRDMWGRIHAGGGFVRDFSPAIRDLDKRLSKLEGKE